MQQKKKRISYYHSRLLCTVPPLNRHFPTLPHHPLHLVALLILDTFSVVVVPVLEVFFHTFFCLVLKRGDLSLDGSFASVRNRHLFLTAKLLFFPFSLYFFFFCYKINLNKILWTYGHVLHCSLWIALPGSTDSSPPHAGQKYRTILFFLISLYVFFVL